MKYRFMSEWITFSTGLLPSFKTNIFEMYLLAERSLAWNGRNKPGGPALDRWHLVIGTYIYLQCTYARPMCYQAIAIAHAINQYVIIQTSRLVSSMHLHVQAHAINCSQCKVCMPDVDSI
jgi:hypothetical protein